MGENTLLIGFHIGRHRAEQGIGPGSQGASRPRAIVADVDDDGAARDDRHATGGGLPPRYEPDESVFRRGQRSCLAGAAAMIKQRCRADLAFGKAREGRPVNVCVEEWGDERGR